jgi:hypothetical protein
MSRALFALALGMIPAIAGCGSSLGGMVDCSSGGNPDRWVDRQMGTDDEVHGGSVGVCAFRTLAYALAHSTVGINLNGADTYQGGVDGVTLPIVLTGTQQLDCGGGVLENAAEEGTYEGIVQFAGTQNGVTDCLFEGLGWGGYLLNVNSSGDPRERHVVGDTEFDHAGNVAIWVAPGADNLDIESNIFSMNNVSILAGGSHANLQIAANTFSGGGGGYDVVCDDVEPGITGASNTRDGGAITCGVCGSCPFGP